MSPAKRPSKRQRISGGFIAVITFKWLKGIAFVIFGIAALKVARLAIMPTAIEIAKFLSVSRENALVQRIAELIRGVTPKQVEGAGIASIFIGLVFFVEGALLFARVWWSTYLTIALTALGIPLEIWEISHRPDSARRYLLLAMNVAILLFLWKRRNEFKKPHAAKAAPAKRRAAG